MNVEWTSSHDQLRPYYAGLEVIHDHYEEVDGLLSGDLPSIIVSSFLEPPNRQPNAPEHSQSYSSLGGAHRSHPGSRSTSPHPNWNLRSLRHMTPVDDDLMEEAGVPATERTPLVVGAREAERNRMITLAINGD